jgi:putative endonuclease
MYYVYLLKSFSYPEQTYTGYTENLRNRLDDHNSGRSPHTSKFTPWKLVCYHAFESKQKALEFEKYLKSGSGKAFANKRFL